MQPLVKIHQDSYLYIQASNFSHIACPPQGTLVPLFELVADSFMSFNDTEIRNISCQLASLHKSIIRAEFIKISEIGLPSLKSSKRSLKSVDQRFQELERTGDNIYYNHMPPNYINR
jgi:hypothetical protein